MHVLQCYSQDKYFIIINFVTIRCIIQMGNIQIKQPNRKTSIFRAKPRETPLSPFREVVIPNSPYYNNFSPIRYAQKSQQKKPHLRQSQRYSSSLIKPSTVREGQRQLRSKQQALTNNQKKQEYLNVINKQNKQKCKEIVKKVRNFNDFLVQLKKRITDDCTIPPLDGKRSRKQLSMSVKLQNERWQLQKYKKLVQRQLSKTHSIQSINILNNQNGEKILTIQYQHGYHQEKEEIRSPQVKVKPQLHVQNEILRVDSKVPIYPTTISKQYVKYQQQHIQFSNKAHQVFIHHIEQQDQQHLIQQGKTSSSKEQRVDDGKRLIQEQKERWKKRAQRLRQAKQLSQVMKKRAHDLRMGLQQQIQADKHDKQVLSLMQQRQKGVRMNEMYLMIKEANKQSIDIQKRIQYLLN